MGAFRLFRRALLLAVVAGCRPAPVQNVETLPVRVSPPAVDFGRTWVGFPSRSEVVLINPNGTALPVSLGTQEPFALVDAPAEVAAASEVLAIVEFRPTDAGTVTGQLAVNQLTVTLTGEGALPYDCAAPSPCATSQFSPDAGTCLSFPRPDGTDCTASNSCFAQARCEAGECVGTLTTCGDGNACTTDLCGSSGCVHLDALPQCPVPAAPCLVATCDPDAGCGVGPAPDGTACGASNCTVALVCVGGSCLQRTPPAGQPCVAAECQAAGFTCGALPFDGGVIQCGTCLAGQICDARSHQCVTAAASCADAGVPCGTLLDACGFEVPCPNTCPGSCLGNTCGPHCVPFSCEQAGYACGVHGDGCGSVLCCGECAGNAHCGAYDGLCYLGPVTAADGGCQPRTCAQLGYSCGPMPDECGGVVDCGFCTAPEVCGGAGTPNVCGVPPAASCGPVEGDFGLLSCGACPPGQSCGGGGALFQCGAGPCTPLLCSDPRAGCGVQGDGCGGLIDCGPCTFSRCSPPLYQACAPPPPLACRQLGLECGVVQSACGPSVDCGSCAPGLRCVGNHCVAGP